MRALVILMDKRVILFVVLLVFALGSAFIAVHYKVSNWIFASIMLAAFAAHYLLKRYKIL